MERAPHPAFSNLLAIGESEDLVDGESSSLEKSQ
mgnify:FL=1